MGRWVVRFVLVVVIVVGGEQALAQAEPPPRSLLDSPPAFA